jgi:CheY-like chemotaxis protein
MSRILLADDSPHAQRMGERILTDEGYEVLTLADGNAVITRLRDFDPDLFILKADLPALNGYQLCDIIKQNPFHQHAKVILTSGAMDNIKEDLAKKVGMDGSLKKPFEASVLVDAIRPMLDAAERARQANPRPLATPAAHSAAPDPELIRAAVAVALDEAYPKLVDDLTKRILLLLRKHAG